MNSSIVIGLTGSVISVKSVWSLSHMERLQSESLKLPLLRDMANQLTEYTDPNVRGKELSYGWCKHYENWIVTAQEEHGVGSPYQM
ncbi:hypothetical protein DY000_02055576 [Brassica cretica]|uniref:Uncharacterized protein n=1 Tax=Brassica cretica TaxID=69181 RepID=A0ABQ7AA10_BRACR|nr:hypothetical protein DY000_02055576 [Brassica cretica]